jgi:hypothetical protein
VALLTNTYVHLIFENLTVGKAAAQLSSSGRIVLPTTSPDSVFLFILYWIFNSFFSCLHCLPHFSFHQPYSCLLDYLSTARPFPISPHQTPTPTPLHFSFRHLTSRLSASISILGVWDHITRIIGDHPGSDLTRSVILHYILVYLDRDLPCPALPLHTLHVSRCPSSHPIHPSVMSMRQKYARTVPVGAC